MKDHDFCYGHVELEIVKQAHGNIGKAISYMQVQLREEVWVGDRERSRSYWCIDGILMLEAQVRFLVEGREGPRTNSKKRKI